MAKPVTSITGITTQMIWKNRRNTCSCKASRSGGSSTAMLGRSTASANNMPPTQAMAPSTCKASSRAPKVIAVFLNFLGRSIEPGLPRCHGHAPPLRCSPVP